MRCLRRVLLFANRLTGKRLTKRGHLADNGMCIQRTKIPPYAGTRLAKYHRLLSRLAAQANRALLFAAVH